MKFIIKSITVILILIFGYILGNIGLENITTKLIKQYGDTNFVTLIGVISSIITVILFFTYIIGKVFLIKQMEMTLFESIDVSYIDEEKHYKITEIIDLGELTNEKIYITPSQPLRYLKIYDFDINKLKKGKLIANLGPIMNGHTIQLNSYITGGMPNFVVEYQRFDFVLGNLDLVENGKSGVLGENLRINHTFRSFIYYMNQFHNLSPWSRKAYQTQKRSTSPKVELVSYHTKLTTGGRLPYDHYTTRKPI
ncbi:hypothetical protein [Halalkalibacter sp. APA_J-10(15)]|uniref:hypothetical protein n=1 Tax=Halalkalibacter sp. APA_J-10(15) TaxID=2933805 RepID=UPI001FF39B66|nr:hypothetical protein [Halalkalibacter sp. APA_J-10(15)]MCK0473032.1 hypothetical protein [Halalkalibacter sp. APA_J-10(15)]